MSPVTTTFQSSHTDVNKPANLKNLATIGISINTLVKLQDDGDPTTQEDTAVYYIGADGKRHAFPNSRVFFTWYSDFSGVQVITEDKLASIPLGVNVTYRPGVKMVKFTTDPKVYVVALGGVLRWVQTEDLAADYYGVNWNQMIDDISDGFHSDYQNGDPVAKVGDYSPSAQTAAAINISVDLSL